MGDRHLAEGGMLALCLQLLGGHALEGIDELGVGIGIERLELGRSQGSVLRQPPSALFHPVGAADGPQGDAMKHLGTGGQVGDHILDPPAWAAHGFPGKVGIRHGADDLARRTGLHFEKLKGIIHSA